MNFRVNWPALLIAQLKKKEKKNVKWVNKAQCMSVVLSSSVAGQEGKSFGSPGAVSK